MARSRNVTGGSDFAYRQTIDDRYKRLADTKSRLRTMATAQAALVGAEAVWYLGVPAMGGGTPAPHAVFAVLIGAAALGCVYAGLPKAKRGLLRAYASMCMVLAIGTLARVALARSMKHTGAGAFADAFEHLTGRTAAYVVGQSAESLIDMTSVLVPGACAYLANKILDDVGGDKKSA